MYGHFDVIDLVGRDDILIEWRECKHSMLFEDDRQVIW